MKKLAVGVGALAGYSSLPEKWVSPIIEGIVLPAHAQTSAALSVTNPTMELIGGSSRTGDMTLRVTGSVSPPRSGADLSLTIEGLTEATGFHRQEENRGASGFLASVADSLVPSAEAGSHKKHKVKVKTDAKGAFSVIIVLHFGPGIVLLRCACKIFGVFIGYIGSLEVPDCDPCTTKKGTTDKPKETTTTEAPAEEAEVEVDNAAPSACELVVTDTDGKTVTLSVGKDGGSGLEARGSVNSLLKKLRLEALDQDALGTTTFTVTCTLTYEDQTTNEEVGELSASDTIFSYTHQTPDVVIELIVISITEDLPI